MTFASRDRQGIKLPTIKKTLASEHRVLRRLGINEALIDHALRNAQTNETTIEQELLASGLIGQDTYYKKLADYLGLPFVNELDTECITDRPQIDRLLIDPRGVRIEEKKGTSKFAIAPQAKDLASLHKRLSSHPAIRWSVVITTPEAIRESVWKVGEKRRLYNSIHRLFSWQPRLSARIAFWGMQGFLVGSVLASLLAGVIFFTAPTLLVLHIAMSTFYLFAVLIRLVSIRTPPVQQDAVLQSPISKNIPIYTVMIALYHEANMIGQLSANLQRLNWPPSKLDIKLVCEADDSETISAIKAARLPPQFELVTVPPAHPRTKPKALTYALSAARGQFLTLYDAEDRPHPDQLREAWARFQRSPAELACLQAPLTISNIGQNWISALFACEYAGLFRGIMPFLARHRFPMPLGGTSNHFRTDILRNVRGWDPYNVAEDADLGLRLHRMGYYCGVINLPTGEDAPTNIKTWTSQRSRWIKGWIQTLLVALREPRRLHQELGTLGLLVFLVNSVGMITSALLHPLLFVAIMMTVSAALHPDYNPTSAHQILSGLDIINILTSYWVFLRLGLSRMNSAEARQMRADAPYLPFYWLMLSYSAWSALIEFYHSPSLWRKTAHCPSKK